MPESLWNPVCHLFIFGLIYVTGYLYLAAKHRPRS